MKKVIEKDKLQEYYDLKWNNKFAELVKFMKKFGHCDVPFREGRYYSLAQWCIKQRGLKKYEQSKFIDYRLRKLEEIGFCWDVHDKFFESKFIQLKRFYDKNGHCKVSKKDKILYKWCCKLREERKKNENRLTKERIQKLDSINFDWEIIDSSWLKKYNDLKKVVEKKKNVFDYSGIKKYRQLFSFVHNTRVANKAGKLSDEKINQLNKIGFIWNSYETQWENRFDELKQYKKKYGHCNVSKSKYDIDFLELADWVFDQRKNYKKKNISLTPERIEKLEKLGFNWQAPIKAGKTNLKKDEDLLNDLIRLQTLLKKTPSILDVDKYGKYSHVTYYHHFGGITNARKKAGLEAVISKRR
jgi:hypothetical protein